MLIHEAIRKAQEAPSVIMRPGFGRLFILVPPSSGDFLYVGAKGTPKLGIGWEPLVEDLMADDWVVTRAEGIEWPESNPAPIQRTWMRFLKRGSR